MIRQTVVEGRAGGALAGEVELLLKKDISRRGDLTRRDVEQILLSQAVPGCRPNPDAANEEQYQSAVSLGLHAVTGGSDNSKSNKSREHSRLMPRMPVELIGNPPWLACES